MKQLWSRISELWCSHMHEGAMWPAHGQYRCATCHRLYAVPWSNQPVRLTVAPPNTLTLARHPQVRETRVAA
jgi:hypothetical protein